MTRDELEHLIRASAAVTDQYEFVIVGSQSILGALPNAADVFTMSAEADIYPLAAPELADKIDGALGEGSQFHETYGYYAQGVGPDTAVLPSGWLERVHRVQTAATHGVGYCLDVVDLFLSKAAAGPRQGSAVLHRPAPAPPRAACRGARPAPRHAARRGRQRRLRAAISRWTRAAGL